MKDMDMIETRGIIGQIARIKEAANLLIEKELRERSIDGIVPAHGPALVFLFQQKEPVPIKAVVDRIGRVKSTVTVMINTLEKYGYVKKSPCEIDNRVTHIELTAKGRKIRKDFDAISVLLVDKLYGKMAKKDREELVGKLSRIEQNLCK
jgi:DNA-binding MarR family transcriptional regulator